MFDSDGVGEKQLLAAVVALAVKDMCLPPIVKKQGQRRVLQGPRSDAATAYGFLFDKTRSGLDVYSEWLDFDADHFRQKLVHAAFSDRVHKELKLDDKQRRNFRQNYKLLQSMTEAARLSMEQENENQSHDQQDNNNGI